MHKVYRVNYQVKSRGNVGVEIKYETACNIQQIFEKDLFLQVFTWIVCLNLFQILFHILCEVRGKVSHEY